MMVWGRRWSSFQKLTFFLSSGHGLNGLKKDWTSTVKTSNIWISSEWLDLSFSFGKGMAIIWECPSYQFLLSFLIIFECLSFLNVFLFEFSRVHYWCSLLFLQRIWDRTIRPSVRFAAATARWMARSFGRRFRLGRVAVWTRPSTASAVPTTTTASGPDRLRPTLWTWRLWIIIKTGLTAKGSPQVLSPSSP